MLLCLSALRFAIIQVHVFTRLFLHLIDVQIFNYKLCFDWPFNLIVQIDHAEVKIVTFCF